MVETRVSRLVEKIVESGWLAALIVVPLLFNVYDERVFEEDKAPLLRSIALFLAVAGLIWLIERGRRALHTDDRPFWRLPLVVPWALMVAVYVLTTLWSVAPGISFWGAYIRRQGTYTNLSYMLLFILIVLLLRSPEQVNRLVTVILLASLPAALYGVVQHFGLDPLPWGGDVQRRVSSVAGNPIFIAAYLIMVVPLTLARVIEHFGRLMKDPEEGQPEPNYLPPSLLAGAYLFLLIVQLLTIVYSQSRGPFLGLGAGLFFFLVVFALQRRRSWLAVSSVALAAAGILFLIVFNLPNSPLAPLRDAPYIGRMGRIFELESGTGRVRVLIWDGVTDLLASNPVRTLTGYGPETLYLVYPPYYPPELGHLEARNASPDRSHNETFDALAMRGVLGFGVQLLLFGAFFYYVLRWLGLIRTRRHRNVYLGLWLVGGTVGWFLPYALMGNFTLSGVGLPAGIAVGMVLYMMGFALTHLRAEPVEHPYALLLVALLSGVMAHFVEIHFGIAIVATRLYFWTYAALAVVVGMPLVRRTATVTAQAPQRAGRRNRRKRRKRSVADLTPSVVTPTLLALSVMTALVLSVMVFDFITLDFRVSRQTIAIPWMFTGMWIFGGLAVTAESAYEQDRQDGWLKRWGVYVAITVALAGLYLILHTNWLRSASVPGGSISADQLMQLVRRLANVMTLFYIWTFVLIGLSAILLFVRDPHPLPRRLTAAGWAAALYPILLMVAAVLTVNTNLNIARADIFSKQAQAYEASQQWDVAIMLYRKALELQPKQDRYFLNLGRAYLNKIQATRDDPAQREALLQEGLAVLEQARDTNPLNVDHWRNLASFHRAWAALVSDPEEQRQHLEEADRYYKRATELSPNNVTLWNDWASLMFQLGKDEQALEYLNQALEIDPAFEGTYLMLADYYVRQGEWEKAREAYQKATELAPGNVQAWSGLAYTYVQLGDVQAAIEANLQALNVAPNDFVTHRNLALLYRDIGDLNNALVHAYRALEVAPESERPAMQAFVSELQQLASGSKGGG